MTATPTLLAPMAPSAAPEPAADDGFGMLHGERGSLPLLALEVGARIAGLAAHTRVRQIFHNAFAEPIEATYIFPLPERAAVTSFRLTVAGRVVEGLLKERGAARQDYDAAIRAGQRAAIAEEDRSGVFSLRVGNLPPREDAVVELEMVAPLAYADGEAEFRFPLVVAPRYVPGIALDGASVGLGTAPDTDQVPDASRVTPPVLLPGFPNPVRLSLEVEIDTAGPAAILQDRTALRASLHSVVIEQGPALKIRLQPGERLNRDFILRFPVARGEVRTTLLAAPGADGHEGVFALTLVPPRPSAATAERPRAVVFVLDRSGSMGGWKMVAARRALARMIDTLGVHDRFAVLAFDDRLEEPPQAHGGLCVATNRERWRALEWLGRIEARGGTEMGPALQAAMALLAGTESGRERVLVLVTDGQVAGEDALLRTLSQAAGALLPRVFALGIDRAVNAGFLRRLAEMGGGAFDLVESEERLDEVMARIHRKIAAPVLTDLGIESIGTEAHPESLAPARLPDLFADCPVTIYGRFRSPIGDLRLRVKAHDALNQAWTEEVAAQAGRRETLLSLWGRSRVRDLEDRYAGGLDPERERLPAAIVAASLEAHVLSRFTAYVAVDRAEVVNAGGEQREIIQPVEMPSGWALESLALPAAAPMRSSPTLVGGATMDSGVGKMDMDIDRLFHAARFELDDLNTTRPSPGAPLFSRRAKPRNWLVNLYGAALESLVKLVTSKGLKARRRKLDELLTHLRTLHDQLRGVPADATELAAIADLIQRAEALITAFDAGDTEALRKPDYEAFISAVREQLQARQNGKPRGGRREKFWS